MKNIHQQNEKHQPHDAATNYNVGKVQEIKAFVEAIGPRFENGGSDKTHLGSDQGLEGPPHPHTPRSYTPTLPLMSVLTN